MIITITNQKGGVGKTTTALNLGTYLALKGKKVMLTDLDPQANLTSGIGFSPTKPKKIRRGKKGEIVRKTSYSTIYDVLIGKSTVHEIFTTTKIENLFLLPSGIELAGAEIELVNSMSRESVLKKALKDIKDFYDYIIIDCPPSLGILTINALVASEQVLIPVQCEYFALEGLGKLLDTIKLIKSNLNRNLSVGGVILTMYDPRTRLSREVATEVKSFFKDNVFKTVIPRNVRLSESPSHGQPINLYEPKSTGAKAYRKLAVEVVKRLPSNK